MDVVPQLDLASLDSARWGCRAVGIGEEAYLRAFDAPCRLCVGSALGEGHSGPRGVVACPGNYGIHGNYGVGLAPARRCGGLGCRACVYGVRASASPRVR